MLLMLAALHSRLLILLVSMAGPGDIPSDLEKWIAIDPPEVFSDGWLVANNSEHEWVVTLRDGRPRVHLRDPKTEGFTPLPSQEVADGWVVGFNAGEFGAGLWWFSPDGEERYKLAEAWVTDFIPEEAGILVLEGIAHGAVNKGQVLRLVQDREGRWQTERFADLGHAPGVAAKDADGSLIIATTDRLLRIIPVSRKTDVLLDHAVWGGLYPNSMVITTSGTIYLGMWHGVAKVEKEGGGYRLRWLLPNEEFVKMKPEPGFR